MFFHLSFDQVQRLKADTGLAITAGALPTAWLANIDSVLKLMLTVVGIISGSFAALYYRRLYLALKDK